MRIGIDARMFGPETGIGRYTENLIRNLELVDHKNEYVIFLSPEKFSAYSPSVKNFTKQVARSRWYTFREQFEMPRLINQAHLDLMHFTHFNVPLLYSVPFVVSIHDLILLDFPTARASTLGPVFYWLKYKIVYPLVIRNAISRAKAIITMADYTKNRIIKIFKASSQKISVIHEGIAKTILQTAYELPPKSIAEPFLLYVGNAYPHKNLEGLVDAFFSLREENLDCRLVLVGKEDYFYHRLKEHVARKNSLYAKDIIFCGFVPDAELAILYKKASAYIFPSFMEGFGLPPLEAMAHGLPVASSSASCLSEILGKAALYFDPRNQEETTAATRCIIGDAELRTELRARGFQQIKKYSWHKCSEETLAVYNS